MKILRSLILSTLIYGVGTAAQGTSAAKLAPPVRHDFVLKNFHAEGGATLTEAHVIYGTYGHLNAAHDNCKVPE